MTYWKTHVSIHHEGGTTTSEDIKFNTGIFQGDTLPPLIFCLALAPISHMLKRLGMGYKIAGTTISNSLYIDDLKVFAADAKQMKNCKIIIQEFINDIGMSFGLEKCTVIHIKQGKVNNTPDSLEIPILDQEESYKYLGILESNSIQHTTAKAIARKEFFKRVRGILKAEINAKHTTGAICTFAMPALRYGFGILKWSTAELKGVDRKLRKMLTKNGFHNPRSNTHRLYLPREKGGRGIIGAEDCHRQECSALVEYISNNSDPLSTVIKRSSPKDKGLLSFATAPKKATNESIDNKHLKSLLKMGLHGNYFKSRNAIPSLNPQQSENWLNAPFMRFETESLLCAAQEQALPTNHVRRNIWGDTCSGKCRLCKEQDETVSHIISGCKMLAGTQYLHRHNQVAKYIHWNILRDNGINTTERWLDHKPTEITTKGNLNILRDSYIHTDKKVGFNKPDIIIHNAEEKECMIIDVAIPMCRNIVRKEAEKITKYRDLEIELKKSWGLKHVQTIPIVVGALGSVTGSNGTYLDKISKNLSFNVIQRTALLGTAHILRNFLTTYKET